MILAVLFLSLQLLAREHTDIDLTKNGDRVAGQNGKLCHGAGAEENHG
jgi:hypothetical protein